MHIHARVCDEGSKVFLIGYDLSLVETPGQELVRITVTSHLPDFCPAKSTSDADWGKYPIRAGGYRDPSRYSISLLVSVFTVAALSGPLKNTSEDSHDIPGPISTFPLKPV